MLTIKTLVFAPYPGLAHITSELREELTTFDVTIIQGDLAEVLPELRKSEENGYDIIISRGGTAKLIRQHTALPVVEIPVSGYDIMRMIALVKGYEAKFEMIGFSNIIENVADVASLMKVELPFQIVADEQDVDAAVQRAKERGVMIVVGDTITVRKAKEFGLEGVLITSGKESVLDAFSRAKEIYRSITFYRNSNLVYRQMMMRSGQGAAIFNEEGKLLEANGAYKKMLPRVGIEKTLFDLIVQLGKVTNLAFTFDDQILYLTGECLYIGDQQVVFMLLRRSDEKENSAGLSVCLPQDFADSFPSLITANPNIGSLLNQIHTLSEQPGPIVLCGEKGVGKRLLAAEMLSGTAAWIEVHIRRGDPTTYRQLEQIVNRLGKQYIHLRPVDQFDETVQQWLVEAFTKGKSRLILSFEMNPKVLMEQGRLTGSFYRWIKDRIVYVPPLRESPINMEEYIRTLIVKFNEKFGKQIVGLRSEVKSALLEYGWPGNLIELRDVMETLVRHSQGPFIEADVLHILEERMNEFQDRQKKHVLNLHQPLEDIERDIINIVMEEEGMNQTKVAERLGINRSTLWRKLRNFP